MKMDVLSAGKGASVKLSITYTAVTFISTSGLCLARHDLTVLLEVLLNVRMKTLNTKELL